MNKICNEDCFNCIYPDCINDGYISGEAAQSRAIDKEIRGNHYSKRRKASMNKYNASEKGKARNKRYYQSEKGRVCQYNQNHSAKGIERRKRYENSEKGKETRRKYQNS